MRISPEAKHRDTKKKTAIVKKTLNPTYNETFQWTVDPSEHIAPSTPFAVGAGVLCVCVASMG